MSSLIVFEEFGSEESRSLESTQEEAQGEFGVTCRASPYWMMMMAKARTMLNRGNAISPGAA
jgi:hypothetical protein